MKEIKLKNYQYWRGKNTFFCDGKIMCGPSSVKRYLFIILVIILPTILEIIFVTLSSPSYPSCIVRSGLVFMIVIPEPPPKLINSFLCSLTFFRTNSAR